MSGIFICYRRGTSGGYARSLALPLAEAFGRDRVFMDTDAIELGDDFVQKIDEALADCKAFVVLIDRDWLKIDEQRQRRRLDDPADVVRIEIETALKRKIRVYPVLTPGAHMPGADQVPASLAVLTRRSALELSDARFDGAVQELIEAIEKVVPRASHGADTGPAAASVSQPTPTPASAPVPATPRHELPQMLRAITPSPSLSPSGPKARRPSTDWKALLAEDRERKAAARATSSPFYLQPLWWLSHPLNFAACAAAYAGAEWMVSWLAQGLGITRQAWPAGAAAGLALWLALIWTLAFGVTSAVAFADDPRQKSVFLTRGLLGGWTLWKSDYEPKGLYVAFPQVMMSAWLLARMMPREPVLLLESYRLVSSGLIIVNVIAAGVFVSWTREAI